VSDLFSELNDLPHNALPYDGVVNYHGPIFPFDTSNHYYQILLQTIDWKNDISNMFGKQIITARKVAWYGDFEYSYTYSNVTKKALIWTKELLELKAIVEKETTSTYNSCLLNLYHNGNEGMGYHSDDETTLKKHADIASLSFGADRKFSFKHKKSKEVVSLLLENASLLVMKEKTQTHWMHRLPLSKKCHSPRINLTFRTIESKN